MDEKEGLEGRKSFVLVLKIAGEAGEAKKPNRKADGARANKNRERERERQCGPV